MIIPHVRLYDSRFTGAGTPVAGGTTQVFGPFTAAGLPADANGVFVNITTTAADGAGWVEATPGVSCHNYPPGHSYNSLAAIQLDDQGRFSLKVTATTHLILDAQGYTAPPPPPPTPPDQGAARRPTTGPLKDRIDASAIPLAPSAPVAGPDRGVIRAWNRYGGLLAALADELGVEADAAAAVLAIESGGNASTPLGPIIRFENHIFFNQWGKSNQAQFDAHFRPRKGSKNHEWRRSTSGPFEGFHGKQEREWAVFEFARSLDATAAVESISIGLAQIMGFNAGKIGYRSPQEMFDAFSGAHGVAAQVVGFFDFVVGAKLTDAVKNHDWDRFARVYNGATGDKLKEYSGLMKGAFEELRAAR